MLPEIPPENFNPGKTFAPWSIQYVPQGGTAGMDLIAISASSTEPGEATPVRVLCSYLAVGESS